MILAALLTVFAAVFLVQLVMVGYIQGVARAAADEGARVGSRVSAGPPACEARATEVFQSLLHGPLGQEVSVGCANEGADLVAQVAVLIDSPTPGMPTLTVTANGRATQEPFP